MQQPAWEQNTVFSVKHTVSLKGTDNKWKIFLVSPEFS